MNRSLRDTQRAFAASLLATDAVAEPRLGIYRNNVRAGFRRALATVFPVVERLVGRDYFRVVAERYFIDYPAREACLLRYGGTFADCLRRQPELVRLGYVAEVAEFEWARQQCSQAADASAVSPERFTAMDPERLDGARLSLHPSVHLLETTAPVDRIWEAHQETEVPALAIDAGGYRLVLYRAGTAVRWRRLDAGERSFLDAIRRRESVGAATDRAVGAGADTTAVASLLGELIQHRLITGVTAASNRMTMEKTPS